VCELLLGTGPSFDSQQAFLIKDQIFVLPCTYEIEDEEEDSEEDIIKDLDKVYVSSLD
jgi:hypothetical protein